MKGGPSIAVMLGGKPDKYNSEDDEDGEPGADESKDSAKDAATALASAVAAKDADGIVRAFRSLSTLCAHSDELEDDSEDEE